MNNNMKQAKVNRTSVKAFIPELEQYVFQGNKLQHIKGSLYQVNGMTVEIHASEPRTDHYFFGTRLYPEAFMCLFVCGKEEVVFCIEPKHLRELPLSQSKDKQHSVFTIVAEDTLSGGSWLVYNKNGNKDVVPLNIEDWCVPLY